MSKRKQEFLGLTFRDLRKGDRFVRYLSVMNFGNSRTSHRAFIKLDSLMTVTFKDGSAVNAVDLVTGECMFFAEDEMVIHLG